MDTEANKCELLGGYYALFLQALLGITALSSLVYKRAFLDDEPKRPFIIWCMDISKQCFSSVLIHFWNLGLSIVLSRISQLNQKLNQSDVYGDECANYLINFIMDTIFGVFLVWLLLKGSSLFAYRCNIDSLKEQGFYADPPSVVYYLIQLFVFLIVTLISKSFLAILFLTFHTEFDKLGWIICFPLKSNPEIELTFVMIIFPSFLNVIQVYFDFTTFKLISMIILIE